MEALFNFFEGIYSSFKLVYEFIKGIPEFFSTVVGFIPDPFNHIVLSFIPIIIIIYTYRVIVG